jgi:hypothetical protein
MYLPYTFAILVSILRNIYSEGQDEELFRFALTSITSRPLGGGMGYVRTSVRMYV